MAPNAAGRATRERLVLAAESLFAERGLTAVSLKEVADRAGQRNTAAVNYHFGNRDGLVRAIFDLRIPQVIEHREELVDKALATTEPTSVDRVRALLEAYTVPLFEQSRAGDFMALAARMQTDYGRIDLGNHAFRALRIQALLREALPQFPKNIHASRFTILTVLTIHAVASRVPIGHRPGEPRSLGVQQWLTNLVDAQLGFYTAPTTLPLTSRAPSTRKTGTTRKKSGPGPTGTS